MLYRSHPLEQQARDIAEQVRGKLTRMGFKHRVKLRDYDELYQVEFSQIEASPDFVKLRIDVDLLPERVETRHLKDESTLSDLGHTLGHPVTIEDRDKKQGVWFVVHLGERDGIPSHISFSQFMPSYPVNAPPMMIPIGAGITGPVWRDLREMPHLLVAGATGKGKSVMVDSILSTLLHLPPTRLRVVLADLKGGMTLGKYKRIPHVSREHYVKRAVDLPLLLLAVQTEMQRRAEAMEDVADDIDKWNRTRAQKWPYILVVIEELANAMLSKVRVDVPGVGKQRVSQATEDMLADIAARARATGIHVIATTQSPRSDVINGIIKANFPIRVAFGTASDMDSRVIIDSSVAQGLDKGRMAFLYNADLTFLQAPMLSEEEQAIILKKTMAGEHWLVARTKEHQLKQDIYRLLEVAERDFANILDLDRLYRAPDIKAERMKPDRIKECVAVMVADGAVSKVWLSRNYRVAMIGSEWREKYHTEPLVLSDWDASIPVTEDGVIDGEVVSGNTSPIPPNQMLIPAPYQPNFTAEIRRWADLGYSRNQMVKRMGIDRNLALDLITSVLGPATPPVRKKGETCSAQS